METITISSGYFKDNVYKAVDTKLCVDEFHNFEFLQWAVLDSGTASCKWQFSFLLFLSVLGQLYCIHTGTHFL